jgi:hypothetical protein
MFIRSLRGKTWHVYPQRSSSMAAATFLGSVPVENRLCLCCVAEYHWCPQRDLNPCYCLERAMS